jgi:hypothetical protein
MKIGLTDDEIRLARDIGGMRYRASLPAVEAYEAGEGDRALELWEEELRRDPGICGMRDRRPPWVWQQDEEAQQAMHDEDFYFVEPDVPGVSGWTKGRRRKEWVQRALPDNCYWVEPTEPSAEGHWGRRMGLAEGNVGEPPDHERDAYEARYGAELSEARYRKRRLPGESRAQYDARNDAESKDAFGR